MKLLKRLNKEKLINPPKFLLDNTAYLTMMGSVAYGVADIDSDVDLYGFCIPPKEHLFPHLAGEVRGFGKQVEPFQQYQKHHINDKSTGKEYDITVYSIVKFFNLCMQCNPNMVDALFTRRNLVIHSTPLAELVRENRKLFLHKGAYKKFKSYAFSQLHKAKIKKPKEGSSREEDYKEHGYSTKFVYHLVRLLDEIEQILITHDLDLMRNKEQLKAIRRGEWTLKQAESYFEEREHTLDKIYTESSLREFPAEDELKTLLLRCLEEHYGSLEKVIIPESSLLQDLKRISDVVSKYY